MQIKVKGHKDNKVTHKVAIKDNTTRVLSTKKRIPTWGAMLREAKKI